MVMAKEEEDSVTGSRRSAILKLCMRTAEQNKYKIFAVNKSKLYYRKEGVNNKLKTD